MTAIGELVVKIVPDAKEFRRDTIRDMKAAGKVAEEAYQDSSDDVRKGRAGKRTTQAVAAGKVEGTAQGKAHAEAAEDQKDKANKPNVAQAAARGTAEGKAQGAAHRDAVEDAFKDFNTRMAFTTVFDRGQTLAGQQQAKAAHAAMEAAERESYARRVDQARAANVALVAAERAGLANRAELNRIRAAEYEALWDEVDARDTRRQREALENSRRFGANMRTLQAFEDSRRNGERLAEQQRYAARSAAMDEALVEHAERQSRAREKVVAAHNARMFRLQQEGFAKQGALVGGRFINGVDAAIASGSGRVTKRTNGLFHNLAGGIAFNAPMFRGLASMFGLMGGQAVYAGAAVAGLGAALKTVAIGAVGVGLGAAAFTALSVASLKVAGTYQMQAAAMNVLMDSTEKGGQMMKDLVNFSKTTPFELEGTIDAAKRLMAMGFAAEEVLPTLTRIGNATAALGTGTEGLSRLALVMGQIRSKGKLMTQDVNQLAEQGIPLWDILATKLGKTRGEVMAMTEEGLVPAETALGALNEYMDMKFSGTLQAQAETLLGTFENLKESFKLGFAQRLQDDLPAIAAAFRDMFPAIEGLSVRLADALGPTLVSYLENAGPAISKFLDSMGSLAIDLMDTWTPVMTQLTNDLASAFENGRAGIQVMSDAFAGMVSTVGGGLPGLATGFSTLMTSIDDVAASLVNLGKNPLGSVLASGDLMTGSLTRALNTVGLSLSDLVPVIINLELMFMKMLRNATEGWASLFRVIPGMDGLADAFDEVAGKVDTAIGDAEGRLARANLSTEVRIELENIEGQLTSLSSRLSGSSALMLEYGVSLRGLATGSERSLRNLLNIPDEILINAGLPAAQLQAEAKALLAFIETLDPEVRATINGDPAALNAAIEQSRSDNEREWIIALQGDPSGILAAAAQANAAVEGVTDAVMIYDNTTGTAKLAADATQAERTLALSETRIFAWDDTTGAATLLTEDQASAKLDELGLKVTTFTNTPGTATLNANPAPATGAINTTQGLLGVFNSTSSTATLNANNAPATVALDGTNTRLRLFNDTRATATLDANSSQADSKTNTSQSKVNAFGNSTGTAVLTVDNGGVFVGVASALGKIGEFANRTFTAFLDVVTGRADGGPIGLASGGQVPVAVSNGEYVLGPRTVNRIGMGNALALNAGIPIKPGLVRGAGTSTSDSIRGTLPPGSFVIKESSVRKLGSGYLRSLATGGSVSGQGGTVKAGNTYNWTVTAKSEPTEETMLTLLRRADAIYGV